MKKLNKLLIISLTSIFSFSVISCNANKKTSNEKVDLTISAAASLKGCMEEIKAKFEEDNPNINLTFNFGSSGSLQKQIEQGAPSDVFISAGQNQMDALEKKGLIAENTRKDLVKNSLVLISNSNNNVSSISDLNSDKVSHIAIGEPKSVPAGFYADETLTHLNMKDELLPKLVYAKDVKEVLSWVMSANSEMGFVYKSDTTNIDSVKIIEEIPEDYHTPINYPVCVIKSSKNVQSAKIFEDYLFNNNSKEIFEKYGYKLI